MGTRLGGRVAAIGRVSRPAAAAVVAVLALAACAGPSLPAASPQAGAQSSGTGHFVVTGYADAEATTVAQMDASAKAMTEVGIDGVNLTANGKSVTAPDSKALAMLKAVHAKHLKASLLVSNWSNDINDFSEPLMEKMFDSPANIRSTASALASVVKKDGFDGVTVDLEALNNWGDPSHAGDDNAGLVAFVQALRSKLGSRTLSVTLTATTGDYADLGYNVSDLVKSVDYLQLMAYDQHGPTWSKAGPVGGMPWVKASVKSLLKVAPASKIQLGVGEYGYTWPKHGTGDTYSDADARNFVKKHRGTAVWSSKQQEWHATLSDGTAIWWSDASSYQARLALALSLHLGGTAVWSLGEGDPLRKP